MPYKIKVEGDFSTAHNLRGYKGKCERLHGHNWKVEVTVVSDRLNKLGMVMDFRKLKNKLNKVLDGLDHRYINELPYFRKVNPTSENIARYIYDKLSAGNCQPSAVTVWESDKCSATYEE